ncbi:MAG: GNAT family N-acetyltransferase [Alphaproteobacteria bacterium]
MALTITLAQSLKEIDAASWDRCATGTPDEKGETDNPFLCHAFLLALEESQSAVAETGWGSAHLLLHNDKNELMGAVPAYLKSHSRGEYVFDHAWADAYRRVGGNYYPKLQVSVPFTPVTGPRLLVAPSNHQLELKFELAKALKSVAAKTGASSVHATFVTEDDLTVFSENAYLERLDQQFHWLNDSYESFDDFLTSLSSRKRKSIRRERRDAVSAGISMEWITGSDLKEHHWDAFFEFYIDTGSRKWGSPYLTREFFSMIGESMANKIVLIMAKRAGRYIAGAINFIGSRTLYGRNWGAIEHHPFLHFETCYYQAMDFAIAHKLTSVEAGAQGEHKLARGYRPVIMRSAHFLRDPGLHEAVANYLEEERAYVERLGGVLTEHLPFRKHSQLTDANQNSQRDDDDDL